MGEIIIRGYGAVFGRLAIVDDGEPLTIMRGAFAGAIAGRAPIALQAFTHDPVPAIATTRDDTLDLFEDDYGLGFEARISARTPGVWNVAHACTRSRPIGASVSFIDWRGGRSARDGIAKRVIVDGLLDHIAIVREPAVRGTCVWRADCSLDAAPSRVRDMAVKWAAGRTAAQARASRQQAFQTQAQRNWQRQCERFDQIVASAERHRPPSIVMHHVFAKS